MVVVFQANDFLGVLVLDVDGSNFLHFKVVATGNLNIVILQSVNVRHHVLVQKYFDSRSAPPKPPREEDSNHDSLSSLFVGDTSEDDSWEIMEELDADPVQCKVQASMTNITRNVNVKDSLSIS
jgi:hypothetical protein